MKALHQHINETNDDRFRAAKVSGNEKLAKKLPTEHLVLTACVDLTLRLSQQSLFGLPQTPLQVNHELDVSTIDLSLFDYLIVYRGHEKFHSKGCVELKSRWFNEKGEIGQVYFGDFDIDGLAIAIDSKVGYQYLLLPNSVYLSTNLESFHSDESNVYRQRALTNRCPQQWQSLLELLLVKQAGLRQQWMFDSELIIY